MHCRCERAKVYTATAYHGLVFAVEQDPEIGVRGSTL